MTSVEFEVPKIVKDVFDILSNDQEFITRIETSLRNIMKDGKIDQYDVPEFILIITDTYNQMSQFELTYDELPQLIKLIYNFSVERFDIIPVDKRGDFERIVDTALRLVMMQPKVKKEVTKLFSCCIKKSVDVEKPKVKVVISHPKTETKTVDLETETKTVDVAIEMTDK